MKFSRACHFGKFSELANTSKLQAAKIMQQKLCIMYNAQKLGAAKFLRQNHQNNTQQKFHVYSIFTQ